MASPRAREVTLPVVTAPPTGARARAARWARTLRGRSFEGGFRLDTLIGVGGMGAVFRGTDAHGAVVAIKLIVPELAADPASVERFQREAVSASRLGGRGVPAILTYGVAPSVGPYIVMELLSGESLLQRLERERRLDEQTTIEIVRDLLEVLALVHQHGIIHRDLKPSNVFLCPTGAREEVKILDFGIARLELAPGTTALTAPGDVLGTPAFMAPEQERGAVVDPRADLYSIGAIAYACLSGRVPRPADGLPFHPPPPLAHVAAHVSQRLVAVVEAAMAATPDRRFESADAMLDALERLGCFRTRVDHRMTARVSCSESASVPTTRVRPRRRRALASRDATEPGVGPGVVPRATPPATPRVIGGASPAPGPAAVERAPASGLAPLPCVPPHASWTARSEPSPSSSPRATPPWAHGVWLGIGCAIGTFMTLLAAHMSGVF